MSLASGAGVRERARRLLVHPRTSLAGKTALAAVVAWLIALQIPGASEYSFYAPFGAVATMHPAVMRSATDAVRGLGAILVGGALGVAVDSVLGPQWLSLAVLVLVGVLLAGIPWFADSRSYVPLAAVFVLLVGQGDEVGYAASYAGLFLLGGLISIAVNAALPSLSLGPTDDAVAGLRAEIVAHLRYVSQHLDDQGCDAPLDGHGPGRDELRRRLARARAVVDEFDEAVTGNVRARRHRDLVDDRTSQFRALERAVLLLDDLYGLSADRPWDTPVGDVSPELRGPMAAALRELAEAMREVGLADTEPGRRQRVDRAVQRLVVALGEHERRHDHDAQALVVATVITTLRRTLSALTPAEIHLSTGPLPTIRSATAGTAATGGTAASAASAATGASAATSPSAPSAPTAPSAGTA